MLRWNCSPPKRFTARASLNGRTPYELARLLLKQELFEVTGAKEVAADKILLTHQHY